MKKLFVSLFVLAATMSVSAIAGDGMGGHKSKGYHTRNAVGLGVYLDTKTKAAAIPVLSVTGKYYTAGLGAGLDFGGGALGLDAVAHLGVRIPVCDQGIALTLGASGGYGYVKDSKTSAPVNVGAFVGVDYHPARHIMLSAQVMPYSWDRGPTGAATNKVFGEGMMGISLLF